MNHTRRFAAAVRHAAQLGAVAGLRSQMPLALLAVAANRGDITTGTAKPFSLLGSRGAMLSLGAAAVGELVADKLPTTPSRVAPGPLAGRALFGGLTGAALAATNGSRPAAAAAIGAAAAVAASEAGYHARAYVGRRTGLPDPIVAIVEDLIALALGVLTVKTAQRASGPAIPALTLIADG